MKGERYSSEECLPQLTQKHVGRSVKMKWPKTSDDTALSSEREVVISGVKSRDTALVDYKGVTFEISRFCLKGAKS